MGVIGSMVGMGEATGVAARVAREGLACGAAGVATGGAAAEVGGAAGTAADGSGEVIGI